MNFRLMQSNYGNPANAITITTDDSSQAPCKTQHTSQWKTTWKEEHVHPPYGHQNTIHQHFNFAHLLPYCKYLYLSKRLSNSLLK